jgi:hypothetical protein
MKVRPADAGGGNVQLIVSAETDAERLVLRQFVRECDRAPITIGGMGMSGGKPGYDHINLLAQNLRAPSWWRCAWARLASHCRYGR